MTLVGPERRARPAEVTFGRLEDLLPREAWLHEARDFTPWLASNLGLLSEAIGIPLELLGQEVLVERFAADIVARNPQDDTKVLIENQLGDTDHSHLGQILTYLAGLGAQTVVWVAPFFREPHLSAMRWLNTHTADEISFIAVRLRVVRIGNSPYAPIFEVVEKPNDWERQITKAVARSSGDSVIGEQRRAFWTVYVEHYPQAQAAVSRSGNFPTQSQGMPGVTVSVWIGQKTGGIYVRGRYGEDRQVVADLLAPYAEWLEQRLGVPLGQPDYFLDQESKGSLAAPETWPAVIDWLEARRLEYLAAFDELAELIRTGTFPAEALASPRC